MDRHSIELSVLAHASILVGFVFRYSFVLPLLIWKTMKHSKYSEHQARQATYYQAFALLLLLCISFTVQFHMLLDESTGGRVPRVDELLIKEIEFGVYFTLSLYALYGACRCSKGEDFRYILLGNI